MHLTCLDLEGVLIPEIWINVAKKTKIRELELTTRDIQDYDVLMRHRLKIMKRHGIRLKDIQAVIATMKPLPGAGAFLKQLKACTQVLILSDTFYEFAAPLMKQLDYPTLFCNWLKTDRRGFVVNYYLRQRNGKEKAVRALQKTGFQVRAAGDSYNDLSMLLAADCGILFNPPPAIVREYPQLPVVRKYGPLLRRLTA